MNRMLPLFSLSGLLLSCLPLAAAEATGTPPTAAETTTKVKHATPADAETLIQAKKVVVIDVRTPDEFKVGHIAGAKNIDFQGADFAKALGKLDRKQTYLVHCAAGGRSTKSLEVFKKLGFSKVVHLDGGFNAWEAAGKPVAK